MSYRTMRMPMDARRNDSSTGCDQELSYEVGSEGSEAAARDILQAQAQITADPSTKRACRLLTEDPTPALIVSPQSFST